MSSIIFATPSHNSKQQAAAIVIRRRRCYLDATGPDRAILTWSKRMTRDNDRKSVNAALAVVVVLMIATGIVAAGFELPGGGQAVIDVNGNAEVQRNEREPREVSRRVDVLYYSQSSSGPTGGTAPVELTLRRAPGESLRVGFFEEEVGGAGAMWRASGWMGTVMAALQQGEPLTGWRVSFDAPGRVDGPSAGCLITAGLLSGLRGDVLRRHATMTGTINPDGTVGPVGGIRHKLAGAAKAGKTLVLIPLGQRYEFPDGGGLPVDLVELGLSLGVQVQEVADLTSAYRALTGVELPPVSAAGSPFPELSPLARQRLEASIIRWITRATASMEQLQYMDKMVASVMQDTIRDLLMPAKQKMDNAQAAANRGDLPLANRLAFQASTETAIAATLLTSSEKLLTGNSDAAVARLNALFTASQRATALVQRMKQLPITSTAQIPSFAEAYASITTSRILAARAEEELEALAQATDPKDKLVLMMDASSSLCLSGELIALAENLLELGADLPGPRLVNPQAQWGWSETIRRAAEANLDYFQRIFVDGMADKLGMTVDKVQTALLKNDFNYLEARAAMAGIAPLRTEIGDVTQSAVAALGLATSSYVASSGLVAVYYSLAADLETLGKVDKIKYQTALTAMLELAAEKSRSFIAAARLKGMDPVIPVSYYHIGSSLSAGPDEDKILALKYYWQASSLCRLMVLLAE